MAKLYYNLIKAGTWTIDKVPSLWKADVQKLLDADTAAETPAEGDGTSTETDAA